MTQPTAYYPAYNFTQYQVSHPASPLPAASLDSELFNISVSVTEICDNLALIQRDDGALANASVGLDQLKAELTVGFNQPTNWVTAHAYVVGDTVYFNNNIYKCAVSHTSTVFATDLGLGYWLIILDFSVPLDAANAAAATAVAASATAVTAQTIASAAAVTASAASVSAASSAATAASYAGVNTPNVFSGDGVTTAFTLSGAPQNKNNTSVYVSGVYQAKTNYTVTGTTISFTTAPAVGTNNIEVMVNTSNLASPGTVTNVSVATANGFAGSVANSGTTPAITLMTSVTGLLKGNGTAISAATAGTDYQAAITLTTTGSSGAATLVGSTLNIPQYAAAGTVTTTGSPASGNLTKFSGASSITNVDLTGDVTTSGGVATTVAKIQGVTISGVTGTGNAVLSSGATLVAPVLGTPASGVATNLTGTAAGLTAGAVSTIATLISAGTNVTITGSGTVADPYVITSTNTAATAFSALTGSTNTSAAMVVGSGASMAVSGSGTIAATSAPASGITGTTLASGVVTSSLTTVGALASGSLAAGFTAVNVAQGGSGKSTFTAYAPVFGGTTTTAALQSGTVGTAGQVLTSNGAGALPTMQAIPTKVNGVDTFDGDGATTAFTLSVVPTDKKNTLVYISGVYQAKAAYTLSSTTLTFTTAPATGTGNVEVNYS